MFIVTGFDPDGRSAYYRRNCTRPMADALAALAEQQGWTRVSVSPESF